MPGARVGADDETETAAELLDRFFGVVRAVHVRVEQVAQRHDLTAPQAMLLRRLDHPVPMRALAESMSCDPSNITGLIDRIERLGFVERTVDPSDRRVRLLALTASGRRVRNRLERELTGDGSILKQLSPRELDELLALMRRLGPTGDGAGCGVRARRPDCPVRADVPAAHGGLDRANRQW